MLFLHDIYHIIGMEQDNLYNLLQSIDTPDDLRHLSADKLPEVCKELRQKIIDELSCNPGHFGSSLGVIELTVALHYVFNTPYDRIVWDVGHQAYGHKILTGRRDAFCTNRKLNGIRPFPSPSESEYDTFTCGHASNSISAALGMAVAAKKHGENNRHVVAVIGDGSMSGGLAFEGLNNASATPNNLLIILNDNNMAIDRSVGGMKQYLLNLQMSEGYNRIRYKISQMFHRWGILNEERRKSLIRFNNSLKSMLVQQQNVFEGMNIRYFGPIDGHDVNNLARVLKEIKDMQGPKLLHIHTTKGKGFGPAEKAATIWHAPGIFDKETGERIVVDTKGMPPLFQDVFGNTLLELAQTNDKIVGVTPAMPSGCSMNILMKAMPERGFDVGIAEGHAVTFSGGMAKDGLLPFCNIYSSFMQRAYDNVIHDIAIQKLNVVLCLDRAGLVGEDGPTHHGAFDLAYMRPIPNLIVASPYNEHELRCLMYTAQLPDKGPFVIRYPRGRGSLVDWKCPMQEIEIGKGRKLKEGKDIAVITLGPIGVQAEGHVQLPAIAPGETGKARFTLPASFREGDVLELEAFDKEGKSICNWTYPIRLAKQYFDHKMAQTPMTLEAVQPATATQTATSIELKSDRVTVTFDPATGMISRIISGGTEVPFKDGPVAVGMKMRYEPTLSYVRNSNEGAVYCAKYKGAADSIVWRLTDKGLLYMDAILLNRASGGGGFDDAFMDSKVFNLGLTFSYPEKNCSGMKWMGRGPYRVWKNRIPGTNYGVWHKEYNNTITGESFENLVYPEFKGYHANMYWATLESDTTPFTVYSRNDGIFFHVFTPEEPKGRVKDTMPKFPEGDISFLLDIPAICSFKPIEQQGPNSQPGNIRIKSGDEGLHLNLMFDFRQ